MSLVPNLDWNFDLVLFIPNWYHEKDTGFDSPGSLIYHVTWPMPNPIIRMNTAEIENPFGFVWLQLCINYNDKVAGKCESNCCEDACAVKRRIEINIFRLETNSNDVKELEEVQRFVPSRRKWFGGNTNGSIFKLEENESYLLEVWFSPTALKFTRVSQQKLFAVRISPYNFYHFINVSYSSHNDIVSHNL